MILFRNLTEPPHPCWYCIGDGVDRKCYYWQVEYYDDEHSRGTVRNRLADGHMWRLT